MTSRLDSAPAKRPSIPRMRRWRRLLLAGWAMFLASFFLPVLGIEILGTIEWLTVFPEMLEDALAAPDTTEFETRDVLMGLGQLSPVILLHVPMFMTLPALRAARVRGERWLGWVLGALGWTALGVGVLHLGWLFGTLALDGSDSVRFFGPGWLGPGYFAWAGSFLCAAFAMRLRAREWASVAEGASRD